MTSLDFWDRVGRRGRRAGAALTVPLLEPLEDYFRLLGHWNPTINLTALPLDPPTDETFDRLLVEPLAAAKQIDGGEERWFDLGSGGGSPAIPLKIVRPALNLTMVESKSRKGAFLREAIRTLDLKGASVAEARFQDLAQDGQYRRSASLVTVRAVRTDDELFSIAAELLKGGGRLLLFRPPHDAAPCPAGFSHKLTVRLTDTPAAFLSIFEREGSETQR